MTEPTDRAVLLLQRVSELLLPLIDRLWHPRGRAERRNREHDPARARRAQAVQRARFAASPQREARQMPGYLQNQLPRLVLASRMRKYVQQSVAFVFTGAS